MEPSRDLARALVGANFFGGDDAWADLVPPAPPRTRLVRKLGSGGAGTVWLARDEGLERDVAIKYLHARGPGLLERFRREARFTARLKSPAIVEIHALGELPATPEHDAAAYIVMEYVDGGNLQAATLSPRALARVIGDVAAALAIAHAHGIVHRDIKPANILLDRFGQPKLTDFGVALDLFGGNGSTLSLHGQLVGTPAAMAPEQARGEPHAVDARTDVYALGATLYFKLCGRWPFEGATLVDVLHAVLHDEPPPPRSLAPAVPRALDAITMRCLAKDPAERYASMHELGLALERYLAAGDGAEGGAEATAWFRTVVRRERDVAAVAAPAEPAFGVDEARELAAWDVNLYRVSRDLERLWPPLERLRARMTAIVRRHPDAAWARYWRGLASFRMGRLDEAVDDVERAIDRMANVPSAFFELGRLYLAMHLRDHRAARRHLSPIGVRDSLDEARARLDLAAAAFREAARANPDLPAWQTKFADAVAALAEDDFDEAIARCEALLALDPDLDEVWKLKGDAERWAGRDPTASYAEATRIRRSFFDAYVAWAEWDLEHGRDDSARRSIDSALALLPNDLGALVLAEKIDLAFARRAPREAASTALLRGLERARRAVGTDASHYEARVLLAETLLALGATTADDAMLVDAHGQFEIAFGLDGCGNRAQHGQARVLLARARLARAQGRDAIELADAVLRFQFGAASPARKESHWTELFDEASRLRTA
ncbi:MAG: protein kinase [Planctomycetes bacterium]|nr:protein kinase [Planctomycetota bacterium]